MNNIQRVEYNNILVLTTQQIAEAYEKSKGDFIIPHKKPRHLDGVIFLRLNFNKKL